MGPAVRAGATVFLGAEREPHLGLHCTGSGREAHLGCAQCPGFAGRPSSIANRCHSGGPFLQRAKGGRRFAPTRRECRCSSRRGPRVLRLAIPIRHLITQRRMTPTTASYTLYRGRNRRVCNGLQRSVARQRKTRRSSGRKFASQVGRISVAPTSSRRRYFARSCQRLSRLTYCGVYA